VNVEELISAVILDEEKDELLVCCMSEGATDILKKNKGRHNRSKN
jgi:hypothetical protein